MSDFERAVIERILGDHALADLPAGTVPPIVEAICGGHIHPGGRIWESLHPDDTAWPAEVYSCCESSALRGPAACLCWEPVYDSEQADLLPHNTAESLPVAPAMCGDCAFRKGSPEREDSYFEETLLALADPPPPVRIELRNRAKEVVAHALVDPADGYLAAWPWHRDASSGYVVRYGPRVDGRRPKIYLHRTVMGLGYRDGLEVDHRNRDRLDNRRTNLRIGSHALNCQNTPGRGDLPRGVHAVPSGRYAARLMISGQTRYVGTYDTIGEAATAAARARADHMPWSADAIRRREITTFFCHGGMRRPVAYRHPTLGDVPADPADWTPPIVAGIPYRADGTPGMLCAGWAARAARSRT